MEYLVFAYLEFNISLSSYKYICGQKDLIFQYEAKDKEICFILAWEHLY